MPKKLNRFFLIFFLIISFQFSSKSVISGKWILFRLLRHSKNKDRIGIVPVRSIELSQTMLFVFIDRSLCPLISQPIGKCSADNFCILKKPANSLEFEPTENYTLEIENNLDLNRLQKRYSLRIANTLKPEWSFVFFQTDIHSWFSDDLPNHLKKFLNENKTTNPEEAITPFLDNELIEITSSRSASPYSEIASQIDISSEDEWEVLEPGNLLDEPQQSVD